MFNYCIEPDCAKKKEKIMKSIWGNHSIINYVNGRLLKWLINIPIKNEE